MSALMGQTLDQKEKIIQALQSELDNERKRRRHIGRDYHKQVKEFELDRKAIEVLKRKSDRMERQQELKAKQEALAEDELDMVPTK